MICQFAQACVPDKSLRICQARRLADFLASNRSSDYKIPPHESKLRRGCSLVSGRR